MKILAMDDEVLSLQRIERLLKELGFTCKCVSDIHAFNEATQKESFDLYILDIHMPFINGLDLAKTILLEHPYAFIIFQTAFEEHALKAFEIGAIDYLLKPFGKEALLRALERAQSYQKQNKRCFVTKNKEESYLVHHDEIIYIEADLNEVVVRTKEHFSYLDKSISQMEKLLDPELFFRIHRSFIINTRMIKQMLTCEQSKLEFYFYAIDDVITSSKEGAKRFREAFKRWD